MESKLKIQLLDLLAQWQSNQIDFVQIHERAEEMVEQTELDREVERTDPISIPFEVLSQLDILNHQLIIQEDIPAMIDFIKTPPGQELNGWKKWDAYWEGIDYSKRREILKGNSYYIT